MHHVPFYSQYDPSVPAEWRERACGIVCLKMALEVYSSSAFSVMDLINEGQVLGAYQKDIGWSHRGLVLLAHNRGVPAYQEEFCSEDPRTKQPFEHREHELALHAMKKFKEELTRGKSILVSMKKEFKNHTSSHLVLLTGAGNGGFKYNDPAEQSSSTGSDQFITEADFLKYWRLLCIVVG